MRLSYSLLTVISLVSCKKTTNIEVKAPPSQEVVSVLSNDSVDLNTTTTSSEVSFEDPKYSALYEAYLEVKAALVNTNAILAQETATGLSEAADGVAGISAGTRKAIHIIITQSDTNAQRAAFEAVSQDVEAILSNKLSSGTIYKQYCPMAFNGKGAYWLSDSKEVRNPYFGDQMLKCGVVDATIE